MLATPTVQAQFETVINLPPDLQPMEIGSDTQLNIFEGGWLASIHRSPFMAGLRDGSSDNVEVNISGGTVGEGFQANGGSRIRISGGVVGSEFWANNGSRVAISGGSVGSFFRANVGSHVTVSGGELEGPLYANSGSIVMMSDGTIRAGLYALGESVATVSGGRLQTALYVDSGSQLALSGGVVVGDFSAHPGSKVSLYGQEFLLSGTPIPGLTAPGDSLVLEARGGQTLTGLFADRSPFEFVLNDSRAVQGDYFDDAAVLRLTVVPEPAACALLLGAWLWAPVRRRP